MIRRVFASFFCFIFLLTLSTQSWARIDFTPTRVLIDSRERSGEITLLNQTDKPGTIRIEVVHYRLKSDGAYETLETPLDSQFDPTKHIRLSPRQFTLPPKGRQTIRISVRRPPDLPEGAYRFHIKATRFANDDEESVSGEEGGPQVAIRTNLGVVVPVIVNQGKIDTEVKISDINFLQGYQTASGSPELHFKLNRSGNGGLFGALQVLWEPDGNGEIREIGVGNNLNMFHELDSRDVKIPLTEIPAGGGRIRVLYKDDMKKKIIDEVILEP